MLPTMREHVTLEDIGRELGLSKATVSRAIAGHPRVAKHTRQRVEEMAKRMGYQPDAALTALAKRRWPDGRKPSTSQIMYLTNRPTHNPSRIKYFSDECARLGYQLQVAQFADIQNPQTYAEQLIDRGIRGVILHAVNDHGSVALPFEQLAPVVIGFGFPGTPLPRVTPDLRGNILMAVHRARKHGYQRFGFTFHKHRNAMRQRILYEETRIRHELLSERFGEQPPILWASSLTDFKDIIEWAHTHKPDVIITDRHKVYYALREAGISIPQDIGFVSIWSGMGINPNNPVTCVKIGIDIVFKQALSMLHQRLLTEEWGIPEIPIRLDISGSWRQGKTICVQSRRS